MKCLKLCSQSVCGDQHSANKSGSASEGCRDGILICMAEKLTVWLINIIQNCSQVRSLKRFVARNEHPLFEQIYKYISWLLLLMPSGVVFFSLLSFSVLSPFFFRLSFFKCEKIHFGKQSQMINLRNNLECLTAQMSNVQMQYVNLYLAFFDSLFILKRKYNIYFPLKWHIYFVNFFFFTPYEIKLENHIAWEGSKGCHHFWQKVIDNLNFALGWKSRLAVKNNSLLINL